MLKKILVVLGKIIRAILVLFALGMLLLTGYCVWLATDTEAAGSAWCETIISQYETDPGATVAAYTLRDLGGLRILEPVVPGDRSLQQSAPRFEIEDNGDYRCSFSVVGGLFPQLHEYSSLTGEWVIYD